MAYYTIATPEMRKTGTAVISAGTSISSPYNYLDGKRNPLFQSNVPFSILFTEYRSKEAVPFRLRMYSPDFFMSTELSRAEFESAVLPRPLHQHNTYELMYVISGELYQRIENTRHRYIPESCCLINRSVRHAEEYETDFHSVNLSLSRDFLIELLNEGEQNYFRAEKAHVRTDLMDFLKSEFRKDGSAEKKHIDFLPLNEDIPADETLSILIERIISLIQKPGPGTSLMIRALIYRIFYYLNSREYYSTSPIRIGTASESRLFAEITALMEETDGRISRSELAEQLSYSGNYLNRIVRKYSGMSIFDYGNSFTMNKAARMLSDTEDSVSDILSHLGFSDRTHFYRLFKQEFGITPREYRLNSRNNAKTVPSIEEDSESDSSSIA